MNDILLADAIDLLIREADEANGAVEATLVDANPSGLNSKPGIQNTPRVVGDDAPGSHRIVEPVLAIHQQKELAWCFSRVAAFIHLWWTRSNDAFNLGIPKTALRLQWRTRRNCLGYFNPDHNEFGLSQEVCLALGHHTNDPDLLRRQVAQRKEITPEHFDRGELLGTLVHEQLHLFQQLAGTAGKGNYHNKKFRTHAEGLGLIVTSQGFQGYAADGPFQRLLAEHGIPAPTTLAPDERPKQRLMSRGICKLKKWVCACAPAYGVRVAIPKFEAQCLRCSSVFRRCE